MISGDQTKDKVFFQQIVDQILSVGRCLPLILALENVGRAVPDRISNHLITEVFIAFSHSLCSDLSTFSEGSHELIHYFKTFLYTLFSTISCFVQFTNSLSITTPHSQCFSLSHYGTMPLHGSVHVHSLLLLELRTIDETLLLKPPVVPIHKSPILVQRSPIQPIHPKPNISQNSKSHKVSIRLQS